MTAEQLLRQAGTIVADRRRTYGDPSKLFERVAVRLSQLLGTEVTATQVGLCLIDLKMARLANNPRHRDSLVDIAGYAACLAEVEP